MRNLLLFVVLLFAISNTLMAQRNVDLAVDRLIEPVKINHNQTIKTIFVVKNLGPDLIKTGDTLFYMAFLRFNQRITPVNLTMFTKNLNVNDTAIFSFDITPEQVSGLSFKSEFCVLANIRNRRMSDSVRTESTSGSANNLECITIDYINAQGWGVGLEENSIDKSSVKFLPNPVIENATITFHSNAKIPAFFTVFDVAGRRLQYEKIDIQSLGEQVFELELKNLKNGSYFYTFETDISSSRGRFSVNR